MPNREYHGFHPDLGPADCPQCGTFAAPGVFQVAWMPCLCPAAQESGLGGHRLWRCRTCEAAGIRAVCYVPPHCPVPGQGPLSGQVPG